MKSIVSNYKDFFLIRTHVDNETSGLVYARMSVETLRNGTKKTLFVTFFGLQKWHSLLRNHWPSLLRNEWPCLVRNHWPSLVQNSHQDCRNLDFYLDKWEQSKPFF